MAYLECLANELLLDVFEYLPSVDLLRCFHGLNSRLNTLMIIHFKKHRLDFRESSKKDFDDVCQKNLRFLVDHIYSLGLSDSDDIPQQIYLFRSYGWNLNQFENLRSLSLHKIRSSEILSELLLECPQIIHLNLTGCYFSGTVDQIVHLINQIWNLSQLIYCYMKVNFKTVTQMPSPTNVSLSLKHLTIIGVQYQLRQLNDLYEHTPNLEYFSFDLSNMANDLDLPIPIFSITELNFSFVGTQTDKIEQLLLHMPNLSKLKIETFYLDIDGYEWERILKNSLPKLNIFQLKMRFQIRSEKSKRSLIKSFQTPFWLDEHQWFIQYHYNFDDKSNMICLYTSPYQFSTVDILFPLQIQSTCLNENDSYSFDYIQRLFYRSSTQHINQTNFHFPNLTHLSITFPINDHLLSIVQKLPRLNSLEVTRPNTISNDDDVQTQIQLLIDKIPHLYSLRFQSWKEKNLSTDRKLTPIILKNQSIRRVNLHGYDHWFNDQDLIDFCHSPLAKNCQILFIKVNNRNNILYLINSIKNLRSLIVHSRDDPHHQQQYYYYSSSSSETIDDQLVSWLKQNLPIECSIKRDIRFNHFIRIWIHL